MAERIQLSEQDLEEVVGGAFIFFPAKGTGEQLCMVEGIGVFRPTSSTSKRNISIMCARAENNGKSQEELFNMAVEAGFLDPTKLN